MADIRPLSCIRPKVEVAQKVSALPYDVYSKSEAIREINREPLSFLKIDLPETQFDDSVDPHEERIYLKAKELLETMIEDGTFLEDQDECYYLYELIMNGRSQTGIVAIASIDDYLNNIIKKHENTRPDKEVNRIKHIEACNAQTGPIFLAYRGNEEIKEIMNQIKKDKPLYSFTAMDEVVHQIWKVNHPGLIQQDVSQPNLSQSGLSQSDVSQPNLSQQDLSKLDLNQAIKEYFENVQSIYIADGHHRAASAVKVGLKRRTGEINEKRPSDYFLSVLFLDEELMILPYNRIVKDYNGLSTDELLNKISKHFLISKLDEEYEPHEKGTFGMYLKEGWYKLTAKEELQSLKDPVNSLDVSLLQDYILSPILNIRDPRTDKRIEFIGGIRGLGELVNRVQKDSAIAFSMYPTSIEELFLVADANQLMPPKSTWFEPKLRSGLFIHKI